jgi:protein-tyrosine phosphatase
LTTNDIAAFDPRIPIAGSHNLRDLGGYKTRDGRQVKRGLLFRSGVMHALSDADRVAFRKLGIAVIYDLRANDERARRPTEWHKGHPIAYHSRDYELSVGALDGLLSSDKLSRESIRRVIDDAYRELPFEQAASYHKLFGLLTARQVPLLFNCTAGKDRTGIAAALILFALGVPRETIDHDYAMTELEINKLIDILFSDPRYVRLARLPREQYLPLFRADPEYLATAFGEIERRHESVERYLEMVLDVGPKQLSVLRDLLLR